MNKVIGTLNRSRGALGNWCVSFGDNTEHGEVGGRDLSTFSFPFFFFFFFCCILFAQIIVNNNISVCTHDRIGTCVWNRLFHHVLIW